MSQGEEADVAQEASQEESEDVAGAEPQVAATDQDESAEAGELASDPTAEGYDEAVETGTPFIAEENILAEYSADPVALTEAEPLSEQELILQEPGRDLRPDTITPGPDITSTGAAAIEYAKEVDESGLSLEELASIEEASESLSPETNEVLTAPELEEDAASSGSDDEEKQDASPDAAQ